MVVAHDLPIKIVLLKNNALAGVMFEQRENSAAAFSPGVAIAALDRLCCLWLRLRLRCFIAVTSRVLRVPPSAPATGSLPVVRLELWALRGGLVLPNVLR